MDTPGVDSALYLLKLRDQHMKIGNKGESCSIRLPFLRESEWYFQDGGSERRVRKTA